LTRKILSTDVRNSGTLSKQFIFDSPFSRISSDLENGVTCDILPYFSGGAYNNPP